jgi:hypothetical protein
MYRRLTCFCALVLSGRG